MVTLTATLTSDGDCTTLLRCGLDYLHSGGAALGAVVTGLLAIGAYLGKEVVIRWQASEARARDRLHLLQALRIDINHTIDDYRDTYSRTARRTILAHFDPGAPDRATYIPFITVVPAGTFRPEVQPEYRALSATLISSIAQYYGLYNAVECIAKDLRSPEYKALPPERRRTVIKSLFANMIQQRRVGAAIRRAVRAYEKADYLRRFRRAVAIVLAIMALGACANMLFRNI